MTARLMLQMNGIDYRRVDLMPVVSKAVLRALRFPANTVPALKIDGGRVQGSRQTGHELDRLVPEPALYPSDPDRRAAVEEAERFGDERLRAPTRRILWWRLRRDRTPLRSFSAGARLGIPIDLAVKTSAPLAGELAMRVVPDYPGRVPPILPAEWLGAVKASALASS